MTDRHYEHLAEDLLKRHGIPYDASYLGFAAKVIKAMIDAALAEEG
jgi:hypothetical protein